MELPKPKPLPYDVRAARRLPWGQRVQLACQAWAIQGYGAPGVVYGLYLLKIAAYVGAWWYFCTWSADWSQAQTFTERLWTETAFQKAIFWSMAFEVLGLGCGSGPLTARYWPPFAACLHFARPNTIRLPLFPWLPGTRGDRRTALDATLYLGLLWCLARPLFAQTITPDLIWPVVILLPCLALRDKTIFLAARGEHYYALTVCFLFGEQWVAGAIAVQSALWIWAAVSKLTHNFPTVVCAMSSNAPILPWRWLKERLYRDFPHDLRPAQLTVFLAHAGTALEFGFPLLLLFGDGGVVTVIGLALMLIFHAYITSNFPLAVPIEWNVVMVYGAFFLFWGHGDVTLWDLTEWPLVLFLGVMLVAVPLIGHFAPARVSFLLSMRYYAGNWPYSIWLLSDRAIAALEANVTTSSRYPTEQMALFYDEATVQSSLEMVAAFRAMHLHGRALHRLLPLAVDDLDQYHYTDGELIAGYLLGWNFGDGHLHQAQLLRAVQERCQLADGDLRCIFVESQPLFGDGFAYEIHDASRGRLNSGQVSIDELLTQQPWPTILPSAQTATGASVKE